MGRTKKDWMEQLERAPMALRMEVWDMVKLQESIAVVRQTGMTWGKLQFSSSIGLEC